MSPLALASRSPSVCSRSELDVEDLEWDEEVCKEYGFLEPPSPGCAPRMFTRRAERECKKRLKAFLAVRCPQKRLDPRIIKLVEKDETPSVPHLHYGLVFDRENREACIARNRIPVRGRNTDTEEFSAGTDDYFATSALLKFLEQKCFEAAGFETGLSMEYPLTEAWEDGVESDEGSQDHGMIAVDSTSELKYRMNREEWWEIEVPNVMVVIRTELGLGSQQPRWWWDSECGPCYECPLMEYNPPQVNEEIRRRRGE